jgi:Mg-chelatase subunit ChlD
MGEDLQEGVSLLLDLSRATDPALRAEARRVAATLVVPAARRAAEDSPGGGAARFGPVGGDGLDLDLDATLEALAERPRVTADDLRWRGWRRPGRAVVLLVDASGSVAGRPLETAVVTAAALVGRAGAGDQLAVVAFWSRAVVLRHLLDPAPAAQAVERLLALRGGDTTDLRRGLTAALAQAALARTSRRDVVVLTDGMANEGSDPLAVAASAAETGSAVHVLGLSDAPDAVAACIALADAGGGRFRPLPTPAQAATAVDDLLR